MESGRAAGRAAQPPAARARHACLAKGARQVTWDYLSSFGEPTPSICCTHQEQFERVWQGKQHVGGQMAAALPGWHAPPRQLGCGAQPKLRPRASVGLHRRHRLA